MKRAKTRAAVVLAFPILALAPPAAPQDGVPSEFQAVYSELSGQLERSTLTRGWDQSLFPVYFGGELTPASAYVGVTQPGYYERAVTPFLDALQSLGKVKVVKFNLHFPLLHIPFYRDWPSSGGMAAYNARLAFYQRLVSDVHARGIKVIVQSMVQGFGGNASIAEDPLNLGGYYKTLSFDDYVEARASHVLAICRLLAPDYINFESEPDYESAKGLQPALDPANEEQFVSNNLRLVTAIRDALVNAQPPIRGLHSAIRLVIGMGSWQRYLPAFIAHYTQMRDIDVIDIHVHPINAVPGADYLADIGRIADAAIAQGKAVGMDETWLFHQTGAELGRMGIPEVDVRHHWGFWSPVDTAFLKLMMDLANFKRMEYVSFGWPGIFFTYLDYSKTPGCPTPPWSACSVAQWNAAANAALLAAMAARPRPLTPTGRAFRALLERQAAAPGRAVLVSAASFLGPNAAPASLVSIFGERLAASTAEAQGLPLPVSLAGTTATLRSAAGTAVPLSLLMVSPTQINAYLPPGIPAGPGEVRVRAGDGAVSAGPVFVTPVAPGLFTADPEGRLAAGIAVTRAADGSQSVQFTSPCEASGCSAAPVRVGADGETAVLLLFGTGIRAAGTRGVAATAGGIELPVLYAGAQEEYAGLDQVNLLLPPALAGKGRIEIRVSAGGVPANPVAIEVR